MINRTATRRPIILEWNQNYRRNLLINDLKSWISLSLLEASKNTLI